MARVVRLERPRRRLGQDPHRAGDGAGGGTVSALLLLLAGFLIRQGLYGWPKNAVLLCRRCEYLLQGLERPSVCPEDSWLC